MCLDAEPRRLTRRAKHVTPLHCPRRHEGCGKGLEAQRKERVEACEVGAKAGAGREDAGEEGPDGEEERDQVEGEHEARQVEVVVCADELRGHTDGGVKVISVWGVERERGDGGAAVGVAVVGVDAADAEEGPSGWVAGVWYAVGRALQEIDLVFWVCFYGTRENDEELQKDTASEEND